MRIILDQVLPSSPPDATLFSISLEASCNVSGKKKINIVQEMLKHGASDLYEHLEC
jgi:hypothetical protein